MRRALRLAPLVDARVQDALLCAAPRFHSPPPACVPPPSDVPHRAPRLHSPPPACVPLPTDAPHRAPKLRSSPPSFWPRRTSPVLRSTQRLCRSHSPSLWTATDRRPDLVLPAGSIVPKNRRAKIRSPRLSLLRHTRSHSSLEPL